MTRKQGLWVFASVGLVAAAAALVAVRLEGATDKARIVTADVTRGHVLVAVRASGSVEALTTVQVGTQVSGTVQALFADFNSLVHAGQVLARLDPSGFQTQVDQARANVDGAEADLNRLNVALADAQSMLARSTRLAGKSLIAPADLEDATVAVEIARAQVKAAEAGVTQAKAGLSQAEVNLEHTVITSPIDGIVISRDVDVGQTVAASMQAPTLFVLAADLRRLRVNASIDESDVGAVRTGQPVTFGVDAFPGETFAGRVSQVRLEPMVSQNVVTYTTMIDVDNTELKLRPGMTAMVTIEVARRDNVLRVPNASLRFRPSSGVLNALHGAVLGAPAAAHGAATAEAPGAGRATLWRYDGSTIEPVIADTGLSDGTVTEIVGGPLAEGDAVVTAVSTSASSAKASAAAIGGATSNPLLGGVRGPRF